MRMTLVSLAGLLLIAASASAAPCAPSANSLCLSGGRFEVSVAWNAQNRTGDGQAVSLTADTGYFWFFSDSNVELIVKVLDARAINGKFWVFFGALSNVEYTLTVRDSVTGASKQYHNPSGQFASVGDTTAFSGSVAAPPTTARVVAHGTPTAPESVGGIEASIDDAAANARTKAATDFTPCIAGPTQLLLSGCRFKVEVTWQDSQGHSGYGQGIQLTSDTGYFWFFSNTNVELMVKVLDARGIDGHFWVFFGALSNVQYRVTVSDVLSNDVKVYTNAQGTFASVGDTSAFSPVPSVAASRDDALSVSGRFDDLGGTLTAAAADGTQYVLTIPPNAIAFAVQVKMTPVDRIDGLPIDGPLVGAVQIEPDGLFLLKSADLKIVPPAAPTLAGLTYFRYRGSGESFTPYPGVPQTDGIELPVNYLAGYGAARGVPSGASTLRLKQGQASSSFGGYIAQAAAVFLQYLNDEITHERYLSLAYEIWGNAWNEVVQPALNGLGEDCDPAVIQSVSRMALEWARLDPDTDPNWETRTRSMFSVFKEKLLTCIDEAYQRCKANNDPTEVSLIVQLARQIALLPGGLTSGEFDAIWDKVEKCLSFELDFESALTTAYGAEDASITESLQVHATIPLKVEFTGDDRTGIILSGNAPIDYESVIALGPPCTYAFATTASTFTVDRLDLGLYLDLGLEDLGWTLIVKLPRDQISIAMGYHPGDPQEQMSQTCPVGSRMVTATGPMLSMFSPLYYGLHSNEAIDAESYVATDWQLERSGNIFGKVVYNRSAGLAFDLTEDTTIVLKHTPK